MAVKRLLTIIAVFAICLQPILSSVSSTSINAIKIENSEDIYSHVIVGVPYVGQNESIGCHYCCITMVFQYYGLDVNPLEVAYLAGAAHGCANGLRLILNPFPIKFPPFVVALWPGNIMAEGQADTRFLGHIHGLSCEDWVPSNRINHNKCWNEYWIKLTNYIKRDVPVVTGIDPNAWPLYKKAMNISNNPILGFAGHSIVIVGFNETNQTVCYHDPMAGYYETLEPEEGTYAWVNLSDFKLAVKKTYWDLWDFSYWILAYEKLSEPPSKEVIYKWAYERNIKKIQGIKSAYDENIGGNNFRYYGINAISHLKANLRYCKNIIFSMLYCLGEKVIQTFSLPGYQELNISSFFQYSRKGNISEFLLKNKEISPLYKHEAELLGYEATCWQEINMLSTEINSIIGENNIINAALLSKPILYKIYILLDNVIAIEQAIIDIST